MPDLRIPEDMILRTARAINAIEDARDQANEDLKITWADLREELKSLGLKGAEVSAEVGYLKAAIAETRKTEADHLKAENKAEGMEGYLSILTSPRARARTRGAEPQPETAEQSLGVTSTLDTSFAGTEGDEGQQPNYGLAGPAYARDDEVANTKPALNSNPASTSPHASLAGEGSSIPQHTPAAPLDNSHAGSSSGRTAAFDAVSEGSNPSPAPKRQWTYADEPDPRCMNPIGCGGTSRFALCGKCKVKAGLANAEAVE